MFYSILAVLFLIKFPNHFHSPKQKDQLDDRELHRTKTDRQHWVSWQSDGSRSVVVDSIR